MSRLAWGASAGISIAVLAALATACGGGTAQLSPTPSSTPRAVSTSMPEGTTLPTRDEPAQLIIETPDIEHADSARCRDPYPNGAPYTPAPRVPLRLRPAGTPAPLLRYTPVPLVREPGLEQVMRAVLGSERAHFGVYVKDLSSGRGGTINSNHEFYAASLYKTWVMLEVEHQVEDGLLELSDQYIVSDYYAALGLNDGELRACDKPSLEQALALMMSVSDNVAGNLLLELVGPANINASLRRLGMKVSGLYEDNSLPTTATEMEALLEAIGRRKAVSASASDAMLALLETETLDDRLPALLPVRTRIAHKAGSWPFATHDAGLVYSPDATYVIVVLTDYDFTEARIATIAQLSRAVYDYYNGRP